MDTIPARLVFARQFSGLTPRGLSVLAGLDPSHVRLIEAGERGRLEATTLHALATTLGVSMGWLLAGEGEPPTEAQVRAAVEAARARVPAAAQPPAPDDTGPVELQAEGQPPSTPAPPAGEVAA